MSAGLILPASNKRTRTSDVPWVPYCAQRRDVRSSMPRSRAAILDHKLDRHAAHKPADGASSESALSVCKPKVDGHQDLPDCLLIIVISFPQS
jgi:hypothetical protein